MLVLLVQSIFSRSLNKICVSVGEYAIQLLKALLDICFTRFSLFSACGCNSVMNNCVLTPIGKDYHNVHYHNRCNLMFQHHAWYGDIKVRQWVSILIMPR